MSDLTGPADTIADTKDRLPAVFFSVKQQSLDRENIHTLRIMCMVMLPNTIVSTTGYLCANILNIVVSNREDLEPDLGSNGIRA